MNGKTFIVRPNASWNVVLTDDEMNCLNRGISPLLIRPQHLIYYFPLFSLGTTDYGRAYILGPLPRLNSKFPYLILVLLLIFLTLVIGVAL